jgi:hypothetical protein
MRSWEGRSRKSSRPPRATMRTQLMSSPPSVGFTHPSRSRIRSASARSSATTSCFVSSDWRWNEQRLPNERHSSTTGDRVGFSIRHRTVAQFSLGRDEDATDAGRSGALGRQCGEVAAQSNHVEARALRVDIGSTRNRVVGRHPEPGLAISGSVQDSTGLGRRRLSGSSRADPTAWWSNTSRGKAW